MDTTKKKLTTDEILAVLHYRKDKIHVGKSIYKHVSMFEYDKIVYYKAQIAKFKWHKFFIDEKEAAKAVDYKLIEKGEQPKNLLKAK
jgi:hypothetical protein